MHDAVSILDRTDHEQVRDEQKQLEKKAVSREVFSRDYPSKRQEVRTSRIAAKKEPKRSKATDGKVVVPSTIPQASIRHLTPPGAHVWVGRTKENWNGHMAPRARISAPWKDFATGEKGALHDVLRRLWQQYAELQGKALDQVVKFE